MVKNFQVYGQFPNFFIGFGRKSLIIPTYCKSHSTPRGYKNIQEIDLRLVKTSNILIFNPKKSKGLETFKSNFHRPLALFIHPSTQQSSAKQVRAYYINQFVGLSEF